MFLCMQIVKYDLYSRVLVEQFTGTLNGSPPEVYANWEMSSKQKQPTIVLKNSEKTCSLLPAAMYDYFIHENRIPTLFSVVYGRHFFSIYSQISLLIVWIPYVERDIS